MLIKLIEYLVTDASCIQISANIEANPQSSQCHDAAVRSEIVEDANQVLGKTVAQNEHEDN